MIELRQNKMWYDGLDTIPGVDRPWDSVAKGLHKFICFGPGDAGAGDSPGGGSGNPNASPFGTADEDLDNAAALAGTTGVTGAADALGGVFGDPFDAFTPPQDDPIPPMAELDIAPAFSIVAPVVAALTPDQPTVPTVPAPPPAPVDVFDVYDPPPITSVLATNPVDPPQVLAARASRPTAPMSELDIAPAPTQPAIGFADSVLDPNYALNPNLVSLPEDLPPDLAEMTGFGPQSRAGIAATPGLESSVYPGFSLLGLNLGFGRGMFGGYQSTDPTTAQSDVDQGYTTSEVGSFDPLGFLGGLAKGVASAVVPGLGLAINTVQQASKPPGMSDINALSNLVSSDRGVPSSQMGAFMAEPYGRDDVPFVDVYTSRGAPTPAPAVPAAAPAVPAAVPAPPPAPNPFSVGFSNFGVRDPRIEELPVRRAQGGLAGIPYFEGRVMPTGDPKEDGMSDNIPFVIAGQEGGQMGMQPAILSPDEYVIPADVVSMLGNGSSTAGSNQLDQFISNFRMEKYGRPKQPPEMRGGLSSLA
jgi:hypothetical protein